MLLVLKLCSLSLQLVMLPMQNVQIHLFIYVFIFVILTVVWVEDTNLLSVVVIMPALQGYFLSIYVA